MKKTSTTTMTTFSVADLKQLSGADLHGVRGGDFNQDFSKQVGGSTGTGGVKK